MKNNKLISMVEFVSNMALDLRGGNEKDLLNDSLVNLRRIFDYATFLKQPLNIGMFIPAKKVGDKWVVLIS